MVKYDSRFLDTNHFLNLQKSSVTFLGVPKFVPKLTALSKFMDNPVVKIATAGLSIDGVKFIYKVKSLDNGVINVGTYYPKE